MASFAVTSFDLDAFDSDAFDLAAPVDVTVSWLAFDVGSDPVDVRVSWLAVDTAAAPVDVRVSWVAFDAAALPVDVKVSWLALDTAASGVPLPPATPTTGVGGHSHGKDTGRRARRPHFPKIEQTAQQRRNAQILITLIL